MSVSAARSKATLKRYVSLVYSFADSLNTFVYNDYVDGRNETSAARSKATLKRYVSLVYSFADDLNTLVYNDYADGRNEAFILQMCLYNSSLTMCLYNSSLTMVGGMEGTDIAASECVCVALEIVCEK